MPAREDGSAGFVLASGHRRHRLRPATDSPRSPRHLPWPRRNTSSRARFWSRAVKKTGSHRFAASCSHAIPHAHQPSAFLHVSVASNTGDTGSLLEGTFPRPRVLPRRPIHVGACVEEHRSRRPRTAATSGPTFTRTSSLKPLENSRSALRQAQTSGNTDDRRIGADQAPSVLEHLSRYSSVGPDPLMFPPLNGPVQFSQSVPALAPSPRFRGSRIDAQVRWEREVWSCTAPRWPGVLVRDRARSRGDGAVHPRPFREWARYCRGRDATPRHLDRSSRRRAIEPDRDSIARVPVAVGTDQVELFQVVESDSLGVSGRDTCDP